MDIKNFTEEELVKAIEDKGLFDESGLVKFAPYQIAVKSFPVLCVDLIPVRFNGESEIGIIIRGTGKEKGKNAIIGGRVLINQSINDAISRHLKEGLSVANWKFYKGNSTKILFMYSNIFVDKMLLENMVMIQQSMQFL